MSIYTTSFSQINKIYRINEKVQNSHFVSRLGSFWSLALFELLVFVDTKVNGWGRVHPQNLLHLSSNAQDRFSMWSISQPDFQFGVSSLSYTDNSTINLKVKCLLK